MPFYGAGSRGRETPVFIYSSELAAHTRNSLELHERIYFIGEYKDPQNPSNSLPPALYYYHYDYDKINLQGVKKLGNGNTDMRNQNWRCNANYNVQSNLVLSPDGNMIYYKGTDNKLWYFFTDREYSIDELDPLDPKLVGRENWNKSPLAYSSFINAPIALQQPSPGNLLWVGSDDKLHMAEWTSADNPLACPTVDPNPIPVVYTYKTDKDSALVNSHTPLQDKVHTKPQEKSISSINVFPNPTNNNFNISISTTAELTYKIIITDILGRAYYEKTGESNNNINTLIWYTKDVPAGTYYLNAGFSDGTRHTSKLIKM